jgi:hypothetical protein
MEGLIFLGVTIGILALASIAFEWQYRNRWGNVMELDWGLCQFEVYEPTHYQLQVEFTAQNQTSHNEVFLLEVRPHVTLLSQGSLDGIKTKTLVVSKHPDSPSRQDGYWESYIVKPQKSTQLEVSIDIQGEHLGELQSLWLRMEYVIYGRAGREPKNRHCIIPLTFPSPTPSEAWRPSPRADVLPIRTHLLSTSDTPIEVLRRYVLDFAQPGDLSLIHI